MKLKLIAPARKPEWEEKFWDLKTLCKLTGKKAGGAPLALPTLAALTPSDVEVVLTDENVEPIDFDEKVDLVGITGMTCVIPRTYEIADEFRKRGVPVALGGIHVSMLPEEAIQHGDSVVIGEAEEIWETVIRDFQKNNLQKYYKASRFPDLTNSHIPCWDLLKNDKYCYFTIQTGRGCPYDCDFCTVKVFNGRRYRHKKIEKVVEEIETLQKIDNKKLIFFSDDNILAIPKYAEELMKNLISLKIKSWWCQSSVNRLKDDYFLDLMHKAGCRVVFIGFESVSQKSIDIMNKDQVNKVGEYREIVNKVHSHRIAVFGSFVLGSDSDNETIFEETIKFIDETSIAFSMINIITPLPGSRLFKKLDEERRILHRNWEKFDVGHVCFFITSFPLDVFQNNYKNLLFRIYSYESLYRRLHYLWNKNIFKREAKKYFYHFTKGRIIFTLLNLFSCNFKKIKFILMGLWNLKITSITSVALAVGFNDFAKSIYKRSKLV